MLVREVPKQPSNLVVQSPPCRAAKRSLFSGPQAPDPTMSGTQSSENLKADPLFVSAQGSWLSPSLNQWNVSMSMSRYPTVETLGPKYYT